MRRLLKKLRSLRSEVHILYLAFRHPGTPPVAKLFVGLIAAYVLSPIDLIPDFIPVLGYVDEIIIVPLLLSIAYRLVPPHVLDDCREQALRHPLHKKLRLWTGAVIVLLIWLLLAIYAVNWFYNRAE